MMNVHFSGASIAAACLLVGCSNVAPAPLQEVLAQRQAHAAIAPIPLRFVKVVYTAGSVAYPTEVTGINDDNNIIGAYSPDAKRDDFSSFTASPPYSSFARENYPARSLVMQSTAATGSGMGQAEEAGWAVLSKEQIGAKGIYGILHDSTGQFFVLTAFDKKPCLSMKLYGINTWGEAVGDFEEPVKNGSGCISNTLLFFRAKSSYRKGVVHLAGNPVITGIDNNADLVGYVTASSGRKEGWYMLCLGNVSSDEGCEGSAYAKPQLVSLTGDTVVNGINDDGFIVGTVTASGRSEGFIENVHSSSSFQYVNVGGSGASTFLNGINDVNYVCGWYSKKGVPEKGFVGIPKA